MSEKDQLHGPPLHEPEPDRLPTGKLALIALATIVFLGLGSLASGWMLYRAAGSLGQPEGAPAASVGRAEVGIVDQRLFAQEKRAQELRLEQRQRLESYGWVDRDGGVIHLPIERAMQLVAEGRR
ncbi:MAG: hypothetical protein HYZ28_11610 [Myxococcales bacterium]|nr:hypothetical protein [Myxococcales bacterium]